MVPERISGTIRFEPRAIHMKSAIVMIYDIGGFSAFANHPDVQGRNAYVPAFLNRVSEALSIVFSGKEEYWLDSPDDFAPIRQPVHEKFLGDGALYVWTSSPDAGPAETEFALVLCNRLWNLKDKFARIAEITRADVPVADLPQCIRFGITRGTVYELTDAATKRREYIGTCINLASRLQNYCPGLGFLASAHLGFTEAQLKEYGYMQVVGTSIKGFPNEILLVDKRDYRGLPARTRKKLFSDA
jgi:class 3 adenylate cyclase